MVITDHKPLVKLFGDKMLDEISNPRLFSLRQRTLQWKFDIEHMPRKENYFADATSRYAVDSLEGEILSVTDTEMLEFLKLLEESDDGMESSITEICGSHLGQIRAVTWNSVKQETNNDHHLSKLSTMIRSEFTESKCNMSPQLDCYWDLKENLLVVDDVILYKGRMVIPQTLRAEVLQSLHAAHQGCAQ